MSQYLQNTSDNQPNKHICTKLYQILSTDLIWLCIICYE